MTDAKRIRGISAVVCNYNGAGYLAECLDSILVQRGVDEVIVVDDASTDGSLELLAARFPDVRVVSMERNAGPAAARNAGLRAAAHRFCLAVDNDAVLEPDVLPKLVSALEADPGVSVAQVRSVLHADPATVHYDGGDFHYVGLLALRNFYRPLVEADGEGVVEANALIGICALMDRDAVLGAGGYDESFFYLAEDYELALRMRILGHRLVSVEDAIVRHRGGTEGLSFRGGGYPARRAYFHARNRWWILAKCYSTRTFVLILPGLALYEAVWLVFAVLQGHLGEHLRGKRDFFRGLGEMRAKRRLVQRGRRVRDRDLLVGGPLTFSPSLLERGPARLAARALDGLLRAWWWVIRPLVG